MVRTFLSKADYTIIGTSQDKKNVSDFSIIILTSGLLNTREHLIEICQLLKPAEIILLERNAALYNADLLVSKNSSVRVIKFADSASAGIMLNIAIQEAMSRYVLVIDSGFSDISHPKGRVEFPNDVAVVSFSRTFWGEEIPSVFAPWFEKKRLKLLPIPDAVPGDITIQLPSYSGIYNRDVFERIGGFDEAIEKPYWQRLEFCLRAYMWGYRIVYEPSIVVEVDSEPGIEDMTPYESYYRFFLKTLAVKIENNVASLPFLSFLLSALRANVSWGYALRQYKEIKLWIYKNRKNIIYSAEAVCDMWN
ncbi:hypothetical protein WKV44_03955 [Spirochaetia bacterium 38H-sp]|uniref:Glycosyltransferase family 2 protein n=1 Tax=Rarispira pelagica TaxID=3141764 RepID=A0ABU9UAJ3_9SPIR